MFGDEWSNSFMDDIAKWQTTAPWTEALPWVIRRSLEKAISSLKRTLSVDSEKSDSKVAKAQTRFCHANIAYVFGFRMISNYEGPCKSPESPVSCGCGLHSTMDNLPSLAVVIRSFEEIRSKLSTFSEELLSDLRKHQI